DVGGADLAQYGTADRHDLRNAKATADLDQLPAREDDFLALAKGTQGNDGGGGVVIDCRGGLGAGQPAKPLADGQLPRRALTGFQIQFEIEITAGGFVGGPGGLVRNRCPAQVRVQDDARGIDNAAQLGAQSDAKPFADARGYGI